MRRDRSACHENLEECPYSPEELERIGYDGVYSPSPEGYRYDDRPEFIKEFKDLISRLDINKLRAITSG